GGHGGHGHGGDEDGAPPLVFTHFTDRSELFVEFPSLVQGAESRFAAHLTDLAKEGPVDWGKVVVVLSGNGPEERFEAGPADVPGIFRPVARPARTGERTLALVHESGGVANRHDLGKVMVFASVAAAKEAGAPEAPSGSIPFLKEQQWKLPFATTQVAGGAVRASVAALGTLRPRPEGEARVAAPVAGRLLPAAETFPRIGAEVERGQVLAVLVPKVEDADLATLDLVAARSRVGLEQARRERERLETLLAQGAVAERRVVEARLAEQAARAEVAAAARRVGQYRGIEWPDAGGGGRGYEVRAPVRGVVVAARVSAGAYVEEGAELFHVADLDRLWLEVRVPEADFGRVRGAGGASFRVDGFEEPFEVDPASGGRLVAVGGLVDPVSRTVPLVFEFANPGRTLPAGASARVRVLTGGEATGLVIPASALQEESGMDLAFVMVSGESFDRRVLKLGIRDGDRVQVLAGLSAGERVVSKGACFVRLAASSGAIPAHGHAH
ncbi:MAG: efflux RND transporter periplasmic adaptor subunit, partial [Deltaproteobacteria bacterium]|nr:efflux RND transporter periplasmic adaptor subunit [Deltaproteobacteria bacterium]